MRWIVLKFIGENWMNGELNELFAAAHLFQQCVEEAFHQEIEIWIETKKKTKPVGV